MRSFFVVCALWGTACTNELLGIEDAPAPHRVKLQTVAVEPSRDWLGDARFSDAEKAKILEGTAWLHEQAGLPVPRITWSELGDLPVARSIRRERGYYGDTRPVGLCQGETIYLDPEGRDDLAGIAAHEMGHCVLGFADDPESEGIMHHAEPMLWTEREEEQCATSPRCSPR